MAFASERPPGQGRPFANASGPEARAMAQLPMYIMPALLHPLYRRALPGKTP